MRCDEFLALIAPHAPAAKTGRPPFDLAMMLRIHCLQQWFGLSCLGAEVALFETSYLHDFVGFSGTERIFDRVGILRFRHLLEEHELGPKIQQIINANLASQGLLLKSGTAVVATFIAAPSFTKNKDGAYDPEMHQVKKGNQWHFEMKAHIGVDAHSGLVHLVIGTAVDVNDVIQGHALSLGEEQVVFADACYQGASKRSEATDVDWQIAMRPSKRKMHKHTLCACLPKKLSNSRSACEPKWNIHS